MEIKSKVRTCLWYDTQALPAAELYVSLLPNSSIDSISYYPDEQSGDDSNKVMLVEFTLTGTPFMGLNGGTHFKLNESVSIYVATDDQNETDNLWSALIADGGSESMCGWLKDKFGLSWQIVPKEAIKLLSGPKSKLVWPELMKMRKIEIAALEKAAKS